MRATPKKVWVGLVGAGAVLSFLASVGPGSEAAADAVSWLLANPIALVLIGLGLLSALLLAVREKFPAKPKQAPVEAAAGDAKVELRPEHLAADKRTFEELVALVPRENIRFLREHDFAGAWGRVFAMSFVEYVDTRNDVEHQFLDPALEEKRQALHKAASALTLRWMTYGVAAQRSADFFELAGSERRCDEAQEGEHYERYEKRRKEINDAADMVASAYDELVLEARRRVP
jgi:hypothetical protein